MDLNPELRD
uniref:Uncharacterized protein n=1 Tax=Arundo donax TaxID=35708 RepID=A0A0A9BX18_ARUDO